MDQHTELRKLLPANKIKNQITAIRNRLENKEKDN